MSSPSNDWVQFYQNNLSGQSQRSPPTTMFIGDGGATDATAVTTTVNSSGNISPGGTSSTHLSPDGRVSKPIRRRSRASRRTPTTLLSTDTTNFRAMVQQFTGGPTAPFGSGSTTHHYPSATTFNFGLGSSPQQILNPNPNPNPIPRVGYNVQYHQQQQQQEYMFSLNNPSGGGGHGGGDHHAFLQRLGNSRPNMEVSGGGFVMEGVSSNVGGSRGGRASSSNENRTGDNYMF